MDRQYIENEQIVERYLSGDLTVREAREFQRFCSAHPEMVSEWPLPAALKAQLAGQSPPLQQEETELATDDRDTEAVYSDLRPSVRPTAPKWSWRQPGRLVPALTVALLFAIAGLIGTSLHARSLDSQLRSLSRQMQISGLQAHSSVQTYRVKLVRGRPQKPTLAVGWPIPPELLDLYIDVTEGNYTSFQVTIDRLDGSRVLQIRRIARDSNRELRLSLNSSAFGRGEYLLKLDGYTWRGQTQELGWIMLGLE